MQEEVSATFKRFVDKKWRDMLNIAAAGSYKASTGSTGYVS